MLPYLKHLVHIDSSVKQALEKLDELAENAILFLVDDQRNDVLSCAGHPIIKTPTVDSLAKNGIRFTNAYVTTSICAASRASILTGLYENKHDYTFIKPPLKTEFITNSYPYLLKNHLHHFRFLFVFEQLLEHLELEPQRQR